MRRLHIPAVLGVSLLAASCNSTTVNEDVVSDVGVDVAQEDVPAACDAEPFVSYCLPTIANSGVSCSPSRVCSATECTAPGCTFCQFAVECFHADNSYCLTTCSSDQCPADCPNIA